MIWLGHRILSAFLTGNRSPEQGYSYVILRIPKNPQARENPQLMKKMILKTLTSFNTNLRNSTNQAASLRGSLLIMLVIGCFALSPTAQAAPAPETPDPGSVGGSLNTADGTNALAGVTTGTANSAFGWFSLFPTPRAASTPLSAQERSYSMSEIKLRVTEPKTQPS